MAKQPAVSPIVALVAEDGTRHQVSQQRQPSRSYGTVFHTTFTHEQGKLARKVRSLATLKVYLALPEYLDWTIFLRLDQRKLGAELGLNSSNISRALAELVELEIVERRGTGPVVEWRLSTDWGWRGTVDQFHAFRRKKGRTPPANEAGVAALVAAEDILWKLRPQ